MWSETSLKIKKKNYLKIKKKKFTNDNVIWNTTKLWITRNIF